ncbi:MAG TPA: BACON domain-containing protein, partial [Blastocatellia bacterium]|nr:BACON domain-containing protein [Blastocatellia bacterium]
MDTKGLVGWSVRLGLSVLVIAFVFLAPELPRLRGVHALAQRQSAPVSVASRMYSRGGAATPDATKENTPLPSARYGISPSLGQITQTLPAVDPASLQGLPPLQIGLTRAVSITSAEAGKEWANRDGSRIRVFALSSPGATGIRLHFDNFDLPDGDQVYVYGPASDSKVAGPFKLKGPSGTGQFWTETLFTDTVIIEHYIKGEERGFRIPEIGHVYKNPIEAKVKPSDLPCELDASCFNDPAKDSVGRYDFVADGGMFVCTGTLINDQANDDAPFFLTANHCINTEAEAQTVEVFWFYQSLACNSAQLTSKVTSSAPVGANLIVNDMLSDEALLSITGQIPNGVLFAGWNTTEQTPNTAIFALDHPGGAIPPDPSSALRRAAGAITDLNGLCPAAGLTKGYTVNFTSGLVEPGASGSGLWITEDGDDHLVGTLSCGSSTVSCDEPGTNEYGRFSDFFLLAQKFLQSGGGCSIGLSAPSQSFGYSGGVGTVNVIATPLCSWSVSVSDTWIAVTDGAGGTGNGTITYAVAANPTGAPRTGSLSIAGQTYSITEGAPAPAQNGELSVDNGLLGNPIGVPGFQIWAVNRLTPATYPATLTSV